MLKFLLVVIFLLQSGDQVLTTKCLKALEKESGLSDPPFKDDNKNSPLPAHNAVQAIITTFQFYCDCVNITSWETFVQPGGKMYFMEMGYDITFQVWRPSPTVQDDGCYSLVGKNVFTSFTFREGGFVELTPTPPSNSIITARSGDVIGYYTNSRSGSNEGIQLETGKDYTHNRIWYHDLGTGVPLNFGAKECQVQTGYGRILKSSIHGIPAIRVSTVSAIQCPSQDLVPQTTSVVSTLKPSPSPKDDVHSKPSSVPVPPSLLITISASNVESFNEAVKDPLSSETKLMSHHSQVPPNNYGNTRTSSTLPLTAAGIVLGIIIMISFGGCFIFSLFIIKKESTKNRASDTHSLSNENYTKGFVRATGSENNIKLKAKRKISVKSVSRDEVIYETLDEDSAATIMCVGSDNSQKNGVIYDIVEDCAPPTIMANSITQSSTPVYDAIEEDCYDHIPSHPTATNSTKDLPLLDSEDTYWAPATTTTALYSQLASNKYREVPRQQIRLHSLLGSGEFGEVYRATWNTGQTQVELAVKTLNAESSNEDRVKFLQEAAIMGQFRHTNVIKMHGMVTIGEPIYICLEMLDNGNLKVYLEVLDLHGSQYSDFVKTQQLFLKFAKEIAAGMEYLSKKSFVHRDLAARNVLLDQYFICKIADFGMARNLMDDDYYTSSGGKIPVKWTAPEALLLKKYSTYSDVWSYGMVLFEIWSVGRKPFSTLSNPQVVRQIQSGFCQAPPPGCPRAVYELMVNCWNPDHQSRPSFSAVSDYLAQPCDTLLYWGLEDTFRDSVGVCGGPLEVAHQLHLDLQKIYMK